MNNEIMSAMLERKEELEVCKENIESIELSCTCNGRADGSWR